MIQRGRKRSQMSKRFDWLKNREPWVLSGLVIAAAAAFALVHRGFVAQSFSIFAVLMAAPVFVKHMAPLAASRFASLPAVVQEGLPKVAPYLVVTIGTLIALGPVALGEMPVSQDHANHYYATHLLVHEMIPSGRFFGWTDAIGTGYPFGDTYHTPSYLVTALLYLISFGLVSLQTSYAFGIVLAWTIPALAVTAWTRRIAGPVGATLAGLAFALDMGSDREGGWIYAMFHGVWAQHFGTGVLVFALIALFRLVEKPTTRRLAMAVLLAGGSLWIHPMNSVTLLMAGLLMFAAHYLVRDDRSGAEGVNDADKWRTLLLVPALFFAGIIGLVWVLRMMLASDVVFAGVAYWKPLTELVRQLFEGALMEHQLAVVSVLGLVGLLPLAATGGRFRVFTLLITAVCLLIGSMAVVLESDMGLAGGSLGIMQYRRFSVAAKPFWFAMSGVGMTAVGIALKNALQRRRPTGLAARVLLTAVLAPFLTAGLSALPELIRSPVAMPLTKARTGDAANLNRLQQALEAEAKRCPKSGCRAVYVEKPGHGGLYPVIAMADLGFAWLPTLTLPANNFQWINQTMDVDVMARRGVSVVISKWALDHERLTLIGRYGRHRLYRVARPAPVRAVVKGPGRVDIRSWEPERRVLRLSGTDKTSGLLVVQPPYQKWHAEQGGRALETTAQIENKQVLTYIGDIGDGDLVLTYEDSALETIASVCGMLLVLLALAGIMLKPRPIPALIEGLRLNQVYHVAGIGVLTLIGIVPLGFFIGGKVAARVEWLASEPPGTALVEVLHQRPPDRLVFTPDHYCVPAYVRNPEFGCAEADLAPHLAAGPRRRGKIPSCLSVGIPPEGTATLTYDLPSGTTHVKGRLHHRRGGEITATSGSQSLGKASRVGRPFQVVVPRRNDHISIKLSAKSAARACIELVALERP